jgi:hypothetical protein
VLDRRHRSWSVTTIHFCIKGRALGAGSTGFELSNRVAPAASAGFDLDSIIAISDTAALTINASTFTNLAADSSHNLRPPSATRAAAPSAPATRSTSPTRICPGVTTTRDAEQMADSRN